MPQIAKGGKYIFGWSPIGLNGHVQIPIEAVDEYRLIPGENVILTSSSKTTGGFTVTTRKLLQHSNLANILVDNPLLASYQLVEGEAVQYKGRLYCWVKLHPGGILKLPGNLLATYELNYGNNLLVIRGSNLAFVMGVKGPIVEVARMHPEIAVFL